MKFEAQFDALAMAVSGLSVAEKRRLLALLDDQLMEEEDGVEDEAVAEIRAQIEVSDHVTLEHYIWKTT